MGMATSSEIRKLARRLAALEEKALETKQPTLAYSTVEDGAIQVTLDDSLKMVVGQQFDGTSTTSVFNGPTPPTPTAPYCGPTPGGIRVRWDGSFDGGALVPMDFQRVEIHISDDPGFAADTADTLVNTFETPRGAEIYVPMSTDVTHYLRLVTRSQSGVGSIPSLAVEVVPGVAITQEEWLTLQTTATDASNTAYAADGRVSISDYEPQPSDVQGKTEGSLWITRTRERKNHCTNPSFEASLADWATSSAIGSREPVSPAADGEYVQRVTNDSIVGDHFTTWGDATLSPTQPGQEITISAYAKLVSGLGTGCKARIDWRDSVDAPLSITDGSEFEIVVDDPLDEDSDFVRIWATGIAPEGAAYFLAEFHNPNADAVWDIDAVLIEHGRLGRYFDGGSEGGSWDENGSPELTTSNLDGGAIIRLFTLEDGGWHEKFWTADTISSVNASVIDRGSMSGEFITDHTISTSKSAAPLVSASEPLVAGDLVNVHDVGGEAFVRPARADVVGQEAHGFVLEAVATDATARVYTRGINHLLTGLSPGPQFLSTTPGKVSSAPPNAAGTTLQRVGFASGDSAFNFSSGVPITLL